MAAVIPKELEPLLAETRLFVPMMLTGAQSGDALLIAREALVGRRKLRLDYADEKGDSTERTVRPLGVFFWGRKWTLSAWCELRNDFRDFRLDRVRQATMLDETFEEEPGRTLRDLLARYGPNAVRLLDG